MDIGWERSRTMSSRLDFRPQVAAWLRPGFTLSTRFSTDRNPSYIEKVELEGDSVSMLQRNFNADRQVTRTLLIDPRPLMQSLFGQAATAGFLVRALDAFGRAIQPLDLAWNTSLNSRFERETVDPHL